MMMSRPPPRVAAAAVSTGGMRACNIEKTSIFREDAMRPKLTAIALSLLSGSAVAAPQDVHWPGDWRQQLVKYWQGDRAAPNDTQVGVAYANRIALESAKPGAPLAYGSMLVFEVWKAKLNADGKPVLDAEGKRIPETLAFVAVMEKQPGFGAGWPEELRNGEWEYAAFTPDGTFIERDYTPCLQCHKPLDAQDYVFSRAALEAAAGH
jgi:hypothetical protein